MKFRKLTAVFLACTMLISLVPSNGVLAADLFKFGQDVNIQKRLYPAAIGSVAISNGKYIFGF